MQVIGLTGSIACGKSTVSNYLLARSFPVVDGDRLSRELTVPGSPVLEEIRRSFGNEYISPEGTLNRRRLGRLIFSDDRARERLDQLMAPHLEALTLRRLEEARDSGAALCFLDMPLLFEKGYDRFCDAVWTVWLPQEIQLSRLMARDGYSREEALSRVRAVMSSDEKARRADRVIDNSGTPEETAALVSGLLEEILHPPAAAAELRKHCAQVPAVPSSSGYPPAPAVPSPPIERPASAMRKPASRKAGWKMPVWLKSSLIVLSSLILVGVTAFSLMSAYLHRQMDLHEEEQRSIDNHYPLLYRELIEQYAGEFNLAPAYVAAIIRNESSFQPRAESAVGARGLMQLMPDTAEWIAHKLGVEGYAFERMYDPASNIRFGCWYLNYLSKMFLGNPVCVTAAYHAGQGQVKVWLSDSQRSEDGYTMLLSALPEGPTRNYTGKVTRDYGIYQEKYFTPDVLEPDLGNAVLLSPGQSGEHT